MKIIKNIFKLKSGKANKTPVRDLYPDIKEEEFWDLYFLCESFTMTSVERLYALYQSVVYITKNNIPGDFIECGVWKGGSSMLVAKYFAIHNIHNRKIILYDTYEGMSEPTEFDRDFAGQSAREQLASTKKAEDHSVWAYSSLESVKKNFQSTGYPVNSIDFIKGKVEDTIPSNLPSGEIALLRLDTDWYESTLHELEHLYPKLVKNGVLIIDDYGYWEGCRKAVDEYFEKEQQHPLIHRIDSTGRILIKVG